MQDESLKQRIQDGTYYQDAQKWYASKFIALISERVFYVVLTTIAVFTLIFALFSVIRLMPIKPTVPFVVYTQDVVRELPLISALSTNDGEAPDPALRRFMAGKYVELREAYNKKTIETNAKLIDQWSIPDAYKAYYRYMSTSNPRSPIVMYEARAIREVKVSEPRVEEDPQGGDNSYKATVNYYADLVRNDGVERTYWTSELRFDYQDIVVDQENLDPDTGRMKVEKMVFKVSDYETRELKVNQNE